MICTLLKEPVYFASGGRHGGGGKHGGGNGNNGWWDDDGKGPEHEDRQLARIFGNALEHSLKSERDFDAAQGLSYAASILNARLKEVFTITSLLAPPLRVHANLLLSLEQKKRVDPIEICAAYREQNAATPSQDMG